MSRSLACTLAVLLAACGSSSHPGASPAPSPALGGTVAGKPFVPADASALVLGEATCSLQGTTASATGLLLGFGSFAGMCNLLTQTHGCGAKASATIVNLLVLNANVAGRAAAPVQPGTYTVTASPIPDPSGDVSVAQAFISHTDPSCATSTSEPLATSGTIRIDSASPRVTGSADLSFDDGSHVAGTFDLTACGFQTDVCTALSGSACGAQTCVP